MDDETENEILFRMQMNGFEEKLFGLVIRHHLDTVIGPLRERGTCQKCHQILGNMHRRLWHQFVHLESYNGFLDGNYGAEDLPYFNYFVPCPFSTCSLKFADFIDAKIHYFMEHQCCQLFCCGIQFLDYNNALRHLADVENSTQSGIWPKQRHCNNLVPIYVCKCCKIRWSSRTEYIAHLQGRQHMCPDPQCKFLFEDNERTIRHFFEHHYKHLTMDGRHLLLSFNYFLKYEQKQEERAKGFYQCEKCHRRFKQIKMLQKHRELESCMITDSKMFTPAVPCKCGHQFVYCYYQRDVLLRHLPTFREALTHIAQEAPFNGMPEDVCNIYHTMLRVLADVNDRLVREKYTNYQRTNTSKHSTFTQKQVAKILLGAVEYFTRIM